MATAPPSVPIVVRRRPICRQAAAGFVLGFLALALALLGAYVTPVLVRRDLPPSEEEAFVARAAVVLAHAPATLYATLLPLLPGVLAVFVSRWGLHIIDRHEERHAHRLSGSGLAIFGLMFGLLGCVTALTVFYACPLAYVLGENVGRQL